jgi:hypothetical protein
MLEVIDTKQTMAFVGAGVTLSLGYPLWTKLIQDLADATVQYCGPEISDDRGNPITVAQVMQIKNLLIRAEIFKANLKDHYFQLMRHTFEPRGSNSDTRALVGVPFQHFLTSNYDPSLEIAHTDVGLRYDSITLLDGSAGSFLQGMANYGYARHIVHVHGRYSEPENIVLTKMEYDSFYARVPLARRFWEIVPVVRRCVFWGFSFSDPELTEKFNLRELNLAHRETQAVGHFAVLAMNDVDMETALRAAYSAEYGVESVFYDPVDAKYTGHSNVIQSIANEFRTRIEQPMPSVNAALPVEIIEVQEQQGEPIPVVALPAIDPADISADLQHLERLTADNLQKRSTGDLQ